jgi:hypothetical protein
MDKDVFCRNEITEQNILNALKEHSEQTTDETEYFYKIIRIKVKMVLREHVAPKDELLELIKYESGEITFIEVVNEVTSQLLQRITKGPIKDLDKAVYSILKNWTSKEEDYFHDNYDEAVKAAPDDEEDRPVSHANLPSITNPELARLYVEVNHMMESVFYDETKDASAFWSWLRREKMIEKVRKDATDPRNLTPLEISPSGCNGFYLLVLLMILKELYKSIVNAEKIMELMADCYKDAGSFSFSSIQAKHPLDIPHANEILLFCSDYFVDQEISFGTASKRELALTQQRIYKLKEQGHTDSDVSRKVHKQRIKVFYNSEKEYVERLKWVYRLSAIDPWSHQEGGVLRKKLVDNLRTIKAMVGKSVLDPSDIF